MKISLVVAMSTNGVIGRNGGLPWHLPGDLKRFKELTLGKPILMGRKTWESLPRRPLPGRDNLVVSRSAPTGDHDGACWFAALEAALAWALARKTDELCVIGGAALFKDALSLADTLHLTRIERDLDGDTVMPPFGPDWVERWHSARFEENGLPFRYIELMRQSSPPNRCSTSSS